MGAKSADTPRFDVVQFVSDNCVALCTLLVIVALSFTSAGNPELVGLLSVVLCVSILTKRSMKLDLWVFIPLILFIVFSIVSSFLAYDLLTRGHVCVQAVLPVIFLAIASMDSREARLTQQMVVAWTVLVSAIGIVLFVGNAFTGEIFRMKWPLTSPNAQGIFLAVAWFALQGLKDNDKMNSILKHGEPLILTAFALTLSLGSFGSFVIGAIAMLLYSKRGRSWGTVGADAAVMIVKLVISVGTGMYLYLAPSWGDLPAFNVVTIVYLIVLVAFWPTLEAFLRAHMCITAPFAILGPVAAVVAMLIRGSAPATFLERLAMIQNGIGYLSVNPLFGVGPFQWRPLNMMDGDLYFNTWHIHNTLLHTAVELGIIAALMLVVVAVRFFVKRRNPEQRGSFIAFIAHNMMDPSFFFSVVPGFLMVTACSPRERGICLCGWKMKLLVGACTAFSIALLACTFMGV